MDGRSRDPPLQPARLRFPMVWKHRLLHLLRRAATVMLVGLTGCSSGLPGEVTPSEISFMVAAEPASWRQRPQHFLAIGDRFAALVRGAQPFDSLAAFAQTLDLSPGTVLLIGESHASPTPARDLTREILARPDAAGVVVWEEGEEWWLSADAPRLRGLFSRRWDSEQAPPCEVISGGSTFNRVFAERCAAGLPDRLLVYAGNSHVLFDPEMPNPYPPTEQAPSPPDAARSARAPDGHARTVISIQTFSSKVFLDRVDLWLAQSIAVAMAHGGLTRAEAIAATNQCVSRVADLREACKGLGSWSAVQSPGVMMVVVETSETRDGVTALSALGHVLTLPQVSELHTQGWTPRLLAASYPSGPKRGRDASFGFVMVPPAGVAELPKEFTVGRNGPGYTPEELE